MVEFPLEPALAKLLLAGGCNSRTFCVSVSVLLSAYLLSSKGSQVSDVAVPRLDPASGLLLLHLLLLHLLLLLLLLHLLHLLLLLLLLVAADRQVPPWVVVLRR
jgi:phosphatidylserine synthase